MSVLRLRWGFRVWITSLVVEQGRGGGYNWKVNGCSDCCRGVAGRDSFKETTSTNATSPATRILGLPAPSSLWQVQMWPELYIAAYDWAAGIQIGLGFGLTHWSEER